MEAARGVGRLAVVGIVRPGATPRAPARPFEELPEHWSYDPFYPTEYVRGRDFARFDQLPDEVRVYLNAAPRHFAATPCWHALRFGWSPRRLIEHLDFLAEGMA